MGERSPAKDWAACSDGELMEALKRGQPAALAVLYDRYAGLVYGLALKILGNVAEAEDLTQEVFVNLWRQPGHDPRQGSLSSFLYGLTRSWAIDCLHSQSSHPCLMESRPLFSTVRVSSLHPTLAPFEQVSIEERRQAVQDALSQLPENQRQILELLYYQGLSQAEIAGQLGIPLDRVKACSRQALCKLRRSLQVLLG